jgi:hypothetical protein
VSGAVGLAGRLLGYLYENKVNDGEVSRWFAEFEAFGWSCTSDILTVSDSRCDSWSVNNVNGPGARMRECGYGKDYWY